MPHQNLPPLELDDASYELFQRIRAAYECFTVEYPGTVYPNTWGVFIQVIRTDEDIAVLFENLARYKETPGVKSGRIFSATNYLLRGIWCTPPKVVPDTTDARLDRIEAGLELLLHRLEQLLECLTKADFAKTPN